MEEFLNVTADYLKTITLVDWLDALITFQVTGTWIMTLLMKLLD